MTLLKFDAHVAPLGLAFTLAAAAQIDHDLAEEWFEETEVLCDREGGRLWGVGLYGPMVFADPRTKEIVANRPVPDAPRPPALGYANAAMKWGDVRWSTFVWPTIPTDDAHARHRLFLHELFHRIQPELGLMTPDGRNDHLDTLEGRYWLQLEWRALAKALAATGAGRLGAVRDALAFRETRRAQFDGAAENERREEIREGLAQYTGTVAAVESREEARADAIDQLRRLPGKSSFVRTFSYPSGAAYGLLLDSWSPGWTRDVTAESDLGRMLADTADVEPSADVEAAAARHGGPSVRAAEEAREAEQRARVAEFRRRFIEGPILVLPNAGGSFLTEGVTAIPGEGTVYPQVRVTADWGRLEADWAFRSADRRIITLPAPTSVKGKTLRGQGWTLELSEKWIVRPADRPGDFEVARDDDG